MKDQHNYRTRQKAKKRKIDYNRVLALQKQASIYLGITRYLKWYGLTPSSDFVSSRAIINSVSFD